MTCSRSNSGSLSSFAFTSMFWFGWQNIIQRQKPYPDTNSSKPPLKLGTIPKWKESPNHPFSGASCMSVSGRVSNILKSGHDKMITQILSLKVPNPNHQLNHPPPRLRRDGVGCGVFFFFENLTQSASSEAILR